MIRYFVAGVLATHVVWGLVVTGCLWYWSRDPKPRGILPFKKVVR